jgi:hypothetical protein
MAPGHACGLHFVLQSENQKHLRDGTLQDGRYKLPISWYELLFATRITMHTTRQNNPLLFLECTQ